MKIYTAKGDSQYTAQGQLETLSGDSITIESLYPTGLFVTLASSDRVNLSSFKLTYVVSAGEDVSEIS
jgi:hypothetical protein